MIKSTIPIFVTIHNPPPCTDPQKRISCGQFTLDAQWDFLYTPTSKKGILIKDSVGNPTLLLMDEPAEGLASLVVKTLAEQVGKLKEFGQTILLSEQNLPFALGVSDRAYVIEKGATRYQGNISELEANEEVKKRYLMV